MPIPWNEPETKDRLLAAIIASFDGKINCREVARLFGEGATYNAMESFLRKPKKQAEQLKAEAEGKEGPAESPARPRKGSGTSKTPRTPKTANGGKETANGGGVKTGRVGKTKATGSYVKKEMGYDDLDLASNVGIQSWSVAGEGTVAGDMNNDIEPESDYV